MKRYRLIIDNIGEIFTATERIFSGGGFLISVNNDGKIAYVGNRRDFIVENPDYTESSEKYLNAEGLVVYPGFVDSHTHAVFASTREDEFLLKAKGATYEEIAAAGGGIINSAKKTLEESFDSIYESSKKRVLNSISYGVTTIEIKSGYGLDTESELKLLRVIKKLSEELPIEIVPTFLGAHAWPVKYRNDHQGYIDLINNEMLPIIKEEKLAEFSDVFCEEGYFSLKETELLMAKAKEMGFKLKLHADEFNSLGATELASEMKAVSVDHLEAVTDAGIRKMAEYGTVANVLPITSVFSRLPFAPAKKIIESGATLSLATDMNPGSCMCGFLPLAASLGATQLGLSVEDSLKAVTLNAAKAVDRALSKGSIEVGKDADILLMNATSWVYPIYHFAHNHVKKIFAKGFEI